ncbi:MAG: Maf family protein [bacterium]|mgnify:CR=1 FL=1|nr:Maf family protein [bacterium]
MRSVAQSSALQNNLVLASSSPRRKELLTTCGLNFEVYPSGIDEEIVKANSPKELVEILSLQKAQDVFKKFPNSFVVGADTVVALDGEILGKPKDRDHAIRMLMSLQGRDHYVWGAFTILSKDIQYTESCQTKVFFEALTKSEIEKYVDTNEPMDKAGSYGAQGIGASFVNRIEGSYTNVVGLPLSQFISAAKKVGLIQC